MAVDKVKQLEREIDALQKQLRQQNQQAETERRKIAEQNKQAIRNYQEDMKRAVREHDEKSKKEYERMLKDYQRGLDRDMQNEIADLNADYRRLLEDVRKSEEALARKTQEFEQAVQSVRDDLSRRNEGSSREAREYLLHATGEFHMIEKKPHEKFMPKRLQIFYNAIKDGQQLYKAGLFEAATAVAISAKSGLERLGYNIDDKVEEWDGQYDLFVMKLNYLAAKVQQELDDWEEYISEKSNDNAELRKKHLVEINYWTRGEFAELVQDMNKYRKIAAEIQKIGKDEYLKKPESANTDELKEYIKEVEKIDKRLEGLHNVYKLRYTASCQRAEWGESIIDFLADEINLEWHEDMTGYRQATKEVLASKNFQDYVKITFDGEEVTEDTREWLKLVFENASENRIYVYLVPVENKSNVENRIIVHIDYNGAEQEIYSRDICQHICEVIKCDTESGIVNYTSDINALKLNTNKSFSDTAKDLENMKKKL